MMKATSQIWEALCEAISTACKHAESLLESDYDPDTQATAGRIRSRLWEVSKLAEGFQGRPQLDDHLTDDSPDEPVIIDAEGLFEAVYRAKQEITQSHKVLAHVCDQFTDETAAVNPEAALKCTYAWSAIGATGQILNRLSGLLSEGRGAFDRPADIEPLLLDDCDSLIMQIYKVRRRVRAAYHALDELEHRLPPAGPGCPEVTIYYFNVMSAIGDAMGRLDQVGDILIDGI